tara:strand:- start:326 stop:538 length:213 start_codon:yes stop_codon:yes gene_type:complete
MTNKPNDPDKPEYLHIPPFYPSMKKDIESKQVYQTEVIEPSGDLKIIHFSYARAKRRPRWLPKWLAARLL